MKGEVGGKAPAVYLLFGRLVVAFWRDAGEAPSGLGGRGLRLGKCGLG